MILSSKAHKQFSSANTRFLDAAVVRFFKEQLPGFAGPELRKILADKLIELFHTFAPETSRLKPGQALWVAIDKNTRADSSKVKYKPVVLTLVNQDDVELLAKGKKYPPGLFPGTIARVCDEAYKQDALLSMRDLALIFKRHETYISAGRKQYEKKENRILPTPSVLQDMGSGVTHKGLILRKLLIEKKDMSVVRNETRHTQPAIDRYLKDYRRVEMLLDDNKEIMYIAQITRMSIQLILQYKNIYDEVKQSN
jgi:hypothetical protein